MSKEEEIRIARESIDLRGFLPGIERLLLAVDESPVGRTAARLAGILAGAQGMPVTLLKLEGDMRQCQKLSAERTQSIGAQSRLESAADLKSDPLAREVKAGAMRSAIEVKKDKTEPDPDEVHLVARVPIDPPAEVVKDEARKGYDLMFVGLEHSVEADGSFTYQLNCLAAGFKAPLIVIANASRPLSRRSRILVPVNGNLQSRRAAEIAMALARATGAEVHALFVAQANDRSRTRLRAERVLKDITELGQRYGAALTTHISARSAAADAIIKEGRRNISLIVMGVAARPGEELFFGDTASAVLKQWQAPILMLAS